MEFDENHRITCYHIRMEVAAALRANKSLGLLAHTKYLTRGLSCIDAVKQIQPLGARAQDDVYVRTKMKPNAYSCSPKKRRTTGWKEMPDSTMLRTSSPSQLNKRGVFAMQDLQSRKVWNALATSNEISNSPYSCTCWRIQDMRPERRRNVGQPCR
jgi:hypothetical protein